MKITLTIECDESELARVAAALSGMQETRVPVSLQRTVDATKDLGREARERWQQEQEQEIKLGPLCAMCGREIDVGLKQDERHVELIGGEEFHYHLGCWRLISTVRGRRDQEQEQQVGRQNSEALEANGLALFSYEALQEMLGAVRAADFALKTQSSLEDCANARQGLHGVWVGLEQVLKSKEPSGNLRI